MSDDLQWLQANAFACDVEINPHAPGFEPVDEYVAQCGFEADDWLNDAQRAEAMRTGKLVVGRVYPRGSVSFFVLCASSDVAGVVAELARLCREDLARPAFKPQSPRATIDVEAVVRAAPQLDRADALLARQGELLDRLDELNAAARAETSRGKR